MDEDFDMDDFSEVYMRVSEAFTPRSPIEVLECVVPCTDPFNNTSTVPVKNQANMQFTSEMYVPESMAQQAAKLDHLATPQRDVTLQDMDDVLRWVFESAMQNCPPMYRAERLLVKYVAEQLKELAALAPDHDGTDELMVLRMMPVIALDRCEGILVGYALGQLLAPKSNLSKKRMLFSGYIMNVSLREILTKSMCESLICDIDIEPSEYF